MEKTVTIFRLYESEQKFADKAEPVYAFSTENEGKMPDLVIYGALMHPWRLIGTEEYMGKPVGNYVVSDAKILIDGSAALR